MPWCGHCQALKPMWNGFVKDGNEKSCYAVSDSVMGENRNIGNEEIKGFPTILINKEMEQSLNIKKRIINQLHKKLTKCT